MASPPTDSPERESSDESPAVPRLALAVVAVGLLASLAVYGLSLRPGGVAADLEWDVIEPVDTPVQRQLGENGSFRLARTTVAAIAPNAGGELIYRVAGVVTVDSGRPAPTLVRCDVATLNRGEAGRIARTMQRRAAWPRPSEELQRQDVPEAAVVKFRAAGATVLGLPIRDAFRRYTDSDAPTEVEWEGFNMKVQNWVWSMKKGTGEGSATLGYAVIFKSIEQPRSEIICQARVAPANGRPAQETIRVPVKLSQWPVTPGDREIDAEAGANAPDVE